MSQRIEVMTCYTIHRKASGRPMPTDVYMPKNIDPPDHSKDSNAAVELIRSKVLRAYGDEPNATQELAEIKPRRVLSKHQRFMAELSSQDRSLAEIQTEWHHYYTQLPDIEKHEVWQEFYAANQHTPYQKLFQKQQGVASRQRLQPAPTQIPTVTATPINAVSNPLYASTTGVVVADHTSPGEIPGRSPRNSREQSRKIKRKIASKVSANGKLGLKQHLQTLGFGLATGCLVLAVFLFTFFNEYVIAPFIQPSRTVSSTPIILSDTAAAADLPPSVTIPKINIQIPINFNVASYAESDVEDGLKSGAIHYPNTALPGQDGNGAYFGHSSGNIFNNGKYKFAFTLLHDLTTGDLFYINYGGKTYAYRIFAREVVPPTAVSVINDTKGKQATAELITCDPPGISTNRLVLWGEQISPSPGTNTAVSQAATTTPAEITGNGPTLWDKLVSKLEFWN